MADTFRHQPDWPPPPFGCCRAFAEVVALEGKSRRRDGSSCDATGSQRLRQGLTKDDIVVVEATGNATAVAEVLAPHVGRVVIVNPKQVRVIAYAKIKTDKIDEWLRAKVSRLWRHRACFSAFVSATRVSPSADPHLLGNQHGDLHKLSLVIHADELRGNVLNTVRERFPGAF